MHKAFQTKSTLLLLLLLSALTVAAQKKKSSIAPPAPITAGADHALVTTSSGKLRGYTHNGIFTFKGIPYGKAERFQPAVPVKWEGIRSSMTYGPVCPIDFSANINDESEFLFHHDWGFSSEDCLRLNIWSKGINDGKKRPVMVWLHGGGYSAGSSQELPSYDGESISNKGDVVLVSINHRLNVLGFLDMSAYGEKYKSSANVGMIDIVTALQWIKDNISAFGGDPGNVTIFGQSGGGGKVITLMNAPSAKGLFHKAIAQSGVVSTFRDKAITKRVSAALLEELGYQPSQADALLYTPYQTLLAASKKATAKVQEQLKNEGKPVPGFGLGWSPSLDGEFLPYQPGTAEAVAIAKDVPLLIGSVKNEFMMSLGNPKIRKGSEADVKEVIKSIYKDKADDFIAAVKKAYPNDTKPSDLVDVDTRFRPGVLTASKIKATPDQAPVYMYMFTWQSPVFDGDYKAVHCMELPFVFNNIQRCEEMTGGNRDAYTLADKMSQSWINFARSGNPAHSGIPAWPAYTPENGTLMIFDNTCETRNHHDRDLLALVGGFSFF